MISIIKNPSCQIYFGLWIFTRSYFLLFFQMSSSTNQRFDLEDGLKDTWAAFTESSDEKCFRKFVRGFINSWEKCNSWDDLMTSSLHGGRVFLFFIFLALDSLAYLLEYWKLLLPNFSKVMLQLWLLSFCFIIFSNLNSCCIVFVCHFCSFLLECSCFFTFIR